MIHFFGDPNSKVYAVQSTKELTKDTELKLNWLFSNNKKIKADSIESHFVGPRNSMITPWSTNAVEITQNMGIYDIIRIEEFTSVTKSFKDYDPMIFEKYKTLNQELFTVSAKVESVLEIDNIELYNDQEGLSLNKEEIKYLEEVSKKIGRKLTDSEVFGFSQVNSEHCRHKIFNGTFVIDGEEKSASLFKMIKETAKDNPNDIVSAYKDNVAFIKGPRVEQFAPKLLDKPDYYVVKEFDSVISIKAETHNFPTTVEPFNGAATGSGGEIRDRIAGGKGAIPLAGTAVYMTSYPRLENNRPWEQKFKPRNWLYQTPVDILIKASNGASDFGNKFGQPLICGSLFTFELDEKYSLNSNECRKLGYDKVIMQAGGIGYGKLDQAIKDAPKKGHKIIVIGGDNYRIGMGGAAVSSADTGEFSSGIELNAVQRSNPEMQKRVSNTVRSLVESDNNFIVSIHDHGAGGHLNCLSELVENSGGKIYIDKLPLGDPTLSAKEIIGNESQERMGLITSEKNITTLKNISERERLPLYEVGEITGDSKFTFESSTTNIKPINLALKDLFGSSPRTVISDNTIVRNYKSLKYNSKNLITYLEQVLQLEAVACKDWLTNKVDRCVGGKVAKQQCVGALQLPLNNVGVVALDYKGTEGIANSIGHSPISALINAKFGSRNSITEALTNIIWAPLKNGIKSISLSANWMWSCKNKGEDARLYDAVKAASDFSKELGINVPTGKDSLSMKQKYSNEEVISPGTVIISAVANCTEISKVVEPVLQYGKGNIYYINVSQDSFKLGGSSFSQILSSIGNEAPDVKNTSFVKKVFDTIQTLIKKNKIFAGHDVASGGLITTLLEMCFAETNLGADFDISSLNEKDPVKVLFSENAGIVFQAESSVESVLSENNIEFNKIGKPNNTGIVTIKNNDNFYNFKVSKIRDIWYKTSFLLDKKQTANDLSKKRFDNYKRQPLRYKFPSNFTGMLPKTNSNLTKPKAAIIREKGSNSEREMANAMYLAGFDVKDVHMTDLIYGRETLEDVRFIGAVGGFSNSDVLGSAKGWAGAFKYNEKANNSLKNFFKREDTLSIGICNGCQLWMELELINPEHKIHGKMLHNDSKKHECSFTSVKIKKNNSVMLSTLAGTNLGVWISNGEGKFSLPMSEENYNIVAKYSYEQYPNNPNGSDYNTAMICDKTGRHLATMPHIERSVFQWNWANYPHGRNDEVSPWLTAFINAKNWLNTNF